MIAFWSEKHLRLVGQSSKALRVENAVAISLKTRAIRVGFLTDHTADGLIRKARTPAKNLVLTQLYVATNKNAIHDRPHPSHASFSKSNKKVFDITQHVTKGRAHDTAWTLPMRCELARNQSLGQLDGAAIGLNLGLSSRKARDGHAVRRAGDVIKTEIVVHLDGIRVAASLTADTADNLVIGLMTTLNAELDKLCLLYTSDAADE